MANENQVVLINVLSVEPQNQEKLVSILTKGAEEIMSNQEGYLGSHIFKSKDGTRVTVLANWKSTKDIEAVRNNPKNMDYLRSIKEIAEASPCLYDLVSTN